LALLLQIDEQFAKKTIFTPKVGLFFKCLSLPIRRRGIRVNNKDGFIEAHNIPLNQAALEPLTPNDFD
jgi:hypothetical protein